MFNIYIVTFGFIEHLKNRNEKSVKKIFGRIYRYKNPITKHTIYYYAVKDKKED